VARLAAGAHAAGSHAVRWDGHDGHGRPVAPGLYLAHLVTEDGARSVRLVRLD
jgi:hypothetical protein